MFRVRVTICLCARRASTHDNEHRPSEALVCQTLVPTKIPSLTDICQDSHQRCGRTPGGPQSTQQMVSPVNAFTIVSEVFV
jgi:hypothetical protein